MANENKTCELCGTPVRVVGKTTLHYEPIETTAQTPPTDDVMENTKGRQWTLGVRGDSSKPETWTWEVIGPKPYAFWDDVLVNEDLSDCLGVTLTAASETKETSVEAVAKEVQETHEATFLKLRIADLEAQLAHCSHAYQDLGKVWGEGSDAYEKRIEDLESKLHVAREALDFYARPDHYGWTDRGELARQALEKLSAKPE